MGIDYLKNNSWSQITREERYFCAHLFFLIRNDLRKFLEWFKTNHYNDMDLDKSWEIGYEVCFYRDYVNHFKPEGKSIRKTEFPQKRTFDLALFANDELIIFEAKVHEDFDTKQVNSIIDDKGPLTSTKSIRKLLNQNISIKTLVIASESYFKHSATFRSEWLRPEIIDGKISWKDLADFYQDEVLYRAEAVRTGK